MNEAQIIITSVLFLVTLFFGVSVGYAMAEDKGEVIGPIFILIVLVAVAAGAINLCLLLSQNF